MGKEDSQRQRGVREEGGMVMPEREGGGREGRGALEGVVCD